MTKEDIIEKLKNLGIITTNCFPKSSFVKGDDVYVGFFKREIEDDFYFYNTYDKKVYKLPKVENIDIYTKDEFNGKVKYLIPLSSAEVLWEDKPFEELPDKSFAQMTLREYACIHTRVPNSGNRWLDEIIKQSKE